MAKHTEDEMYQLSLDDLKKGATEEEGALQKALTEPPQSKNNPQSALARALGVHEEPEVEDEEPETFIARRELDLGDGAGVEVFEAEGTTEKEALDNLVDKIADAKLNATKKIREQEQSLKELRARTAEPPKPKQLSPDDEYVLTQELQKEPSKAFRKMFKEFTGYEPEEVGGMKQATDYVRNAERWQDTINTFIATHPDYVNHGEDGTKNEQLMYMKLGEVTGVPITNRETLYKVGTSENLSKAYSQLKQSGLLLLKGEEAHADTDGKATETERIAPTRVEPAPQRTKKTSTIGTHNRTTTVPANTEPSEDDAYKMPLEKLRELANKSFGAR